MTRQIIVVIIYPSLTNSGGKGFLRKILTNIHFWLLFVINKAAKNIRVNTKNLHE